MSEPTINPECLPETQAPADTPLVERLLEDQCRRWRRGEAVPVEAYREQHPELAGDPDGLLDLIFNEVIERQQRGQTPALEEYLERFPACAGRLRGEFELHRALATSVPAQTPAPAEVPGVAGRYRLCGEISRGGGGIIFRARDLELGRDLAVKVLLETHRGQPVLVRRFLEEAQVCGQLQHPAIVPVHEVGELADGRPYFAMKLVQGRTLAALLRDRPAPEQDRPRFLQVFASVCQAVAYAHSKGVIHRDLKPSNVMVGEFGEVQVMDWGLAKVLAESGANTEVRTVRTEMTGATSQVGAVMGTPAYMAPEQARGEVDRLDERTDVFGLGAILCEILTGQPPYFGPRQELRARAARGDLADARARLESCGADAELVRLAQGCLAANPQERPGDSGAVAERLAAYLAGVQERLRQAELAQARAEEQRKRRRLVLALVASVLLTLSAVGGTAWYLRQQRVQAQAAEALADAERARQVEGDLLEVAEQRRLQRPERAWEALQRAEGRLSGSADQELKDRVARVRAQLEQTRRKQELLARLEEAGLQSAAVGGAGGFDHAGANRLFREAFARYLGADLEQLSAEEAARRLSDPALTEPLLVALDEWAVALHKSRGDARVRAVADRLDSDEWRRRLRRAIARRDGKAIRRLTGPLLPGPLPPASVLLLADGLALVGELERGLEALRQAQRHKRGDFWLCFQRASAAYTSGPGGLDEAIRFYTAALALRPRSVVVHNNLGVALKAQGKLSEAVAVLEAALHLKPDCAGAHANLGDALRVRGKLAEAVAACKEAIRLNKDDPGAHNNLGLALKAQGKLAEAVAELVEAIRLDPDNHKSYSNLGATLCTQGKLAEAVAACEKAIRLKPDYQSAHINLGDALHKQGKLAEAVARFEKAILLGPNSYVAYYNLGNVLRDQGKRAEAVAAYREAIGRNKGYHEAHNALGLALKAQGKLAEAVASIKEAIRLKPDDHNYPYCLGNTFLALGDFARAAEAYRKAIELAPTYAEAHCNLGHALGALGQFQAALASLRRGHELGSKRPDWSNPSAAWVKQYQPLAELDARLPAILQGRDSPKDATEQLALAFLCLSPARKLYATSVRFAEAAFKAEPRLADDLRARHRYHAAFGAALAAAGQGKEAAALNDQQRAALRGQALHWLRADLKARSALLDRNETARPFVRQRLTEWQSTGAFASVRDRAALEKLPPDERREWEKLWADVADLLEQTGKSSPPNPE